MTDVKTLTKGRLSYSIKEFSDITGISQDVLMRHINGFTDTPLEVFYPSAKAMIDAEEGARWRKTLPNEKPAGRS